MALAAPDKPWPETFLSFQTYLLDPFFLWAPTDARNEVVAWARDIFTAQLAVKTPFLKDLPDDCGGDILEYFEICEEMCLTLTHSPEATAWVRAVVVAGIASVNMVSNPTSTSAHRRHVFFAPSSLISS